jgi:hypothetical protein
VDMANCRLQRGSVELYQQEWSFGGRQSQKPTTARHLLTAC